MFEIISAILQLISRIDPKFNHFKMASWPSFFQKQTVESSPSFFDELMIFFKGLFDIESSDFSLHNLVYDNSAESIRPWIVQVVISTYHRVLNVLYSLDYRYLYIIGILLLIALLRIIYKKQSYKKIPDSDIVEIKEEQLIIHRSSNLPHFLKHSLVSIVILCFIASIPWEFMRLYQLEVAKRSAITIKEIPPECLLSSMTFWHELLVWARSTFSWNKDPCQTYYEMLMVDPIWEVTPLLILSSLTSRFLVKPAEVFTSCFSSCLRILMAEIPVQWQPLVLTLCLSSIVLLILVSCQYRLAIMPLLKIEPGYQKKDKFSEETNKTNKIIFRQNVPEQRRGRKKIAVSNNR